MNAKLKEAIKIVREYRKWENSWGNPNIPNFSPYTDKSYQEAIDTVVKALEKPLLTDDQIKQLITEAVEKEKECIRQFLIDDGYELLADKI